MLKLTQLSVIYPDKTRAVDSIDLTIHDGETVALIGANGAGKTSLLLALVGVVASQGTIEVDQLKLEPHTVGEIRKRIGVVFQNPDNQLFMPSIYEDVAFGLRNYGIAEEEIEATVDRCLDQLDIMKLKHRSPLKLSGGEKRMAAIAGVLVMEPSLMLFDEPTAFLDPKARRNLIQSLQKLKPTKLIATHDLPFVAEVCSRAILLKDGKIFADGDPHTMLYDKKLMEECAIEAAVRPMEEK